MTSSRSLALVPYVPPAENSSVISDAYEYRRRLYAFSFVCSVCVVFASLCFCKRFGISFGSTFLSGDALYLHFRYVLFMFIVGFTIFSPAVYFFSLCAYSFYYGGAFFAAEGFAPRLAICLFLFTSILYFCELCLCFDRTKYGIRKIFSAPLVLAFSVKTLLYLGFSLAFFHFM